MSKKVVFISSSGGHLEQLLNLKTTMKGFDSHIITELNPSTRNLKDNFDSVHYLPFFSRQNKLTFPFVFLKIILKTIFLLRKISPDVIVTTGAGMVVPFVILGKLSGKKIIYIETFSRIKSATLSGRVCYRFSDVFVVQWKEVQKLYPKSVYFGSIY